MLSPDEINGMLVNQLKEELKARGASTAGKKNELYARLLELAAGEQEGTAAASPTPGGEDKAAVDTDGKGSAVDRKDEMREDADPAPVEESAAADNVVDNEGSAAAASEVAAEEGGSATAAVGSTSSQADTSVGVAAEESAASGSADDSGSATGSSDAAKEVVVGSYRHVRIDNFQRPLNQKALVEWIEVQSQCTLLPESLWINAIKTHCYVDFRNEEEAQRCITKVTGQRYPATSAYTLVADFTSVSAKEAPTAEEAALMPGKWKVLPGQVHAPAAPSDMTIKTILPLRGAEIDVQDSVSAHAQRSPPAAGSKRRLEETGEQVEDGAASPLASPSTATSALVAGTGESGSKARKLTGGMDIFRRATAGILLGRPAGNAAGSNKLGNVGVQPGQPSASTPSVTGLISRNRRLGEDAENDARGDDTDNHGSGAGNGNGNGGKGLDELFRKTVVATPALYWLPAPDEVVQQRLKSRLKMKATNNAKK